MKQVLIRRGRAEVAEVPAPLIEKGHVLVEVAYSLISAGTEMSGVEGSGKSMVQRALQQPDKVLQVVDHLRKQGLQRTVARVRGQLDAGHATGYSCAGTVIQVGEGVTDLHVGDRVACAGAAIANHAEIVLAPRNLIVKVPDACPLKAAASVTLGAIAMQGVRRAEPRLGEIVAVIGLGLLGQLTVQLLKAAGCYVIGFDLDPRRVELARQLGADHTFLTADIDPLNEVRHRTGNHGVDAVIITAASQSDALVQQAMQMARRKGRVVVVGAVGLALKRSPFYEKELDFLISCSYGPGRYDAHYEEEGVDYPYAYVRWTENRNMAEYLQLVATGKIQLEAILEREYVVTEATQAYQSLQAEGPKPLGVILRYPVTDIAGQQVKLNTKVQLSQKTVKGKVRVALIGAGGFARGMHLPNMQRLSNLYHLRAVVSSTGSNTKNMGVQYGADYVSTNLDDVLADPEVDAVVIATRHHLHARQTIAAARAGKAIFLEKPMALNPTELAEVAAVLAETSVPFMVGFNRRFAPAVQRARELIGNRTNPLMMAYRVNAGYLPPDHWTLGPEGGGRIIGEACHMFDLFQALVGGAQVTDVCALAAQPATAHLSSADNVATTLRYSDGSVATLLYTALGAVDYPKEELEIYSDGKVLVLDDFKALRVYGAKAAGWQSAVMDKGHLAELESFARYVQGQQATPIALADLIETTKISFIAAGRSE